MTESQKHKHSCYEWIQLFIAFSIPVAIAVYTVLENNRDFTISSRNRAQDLEMAANQQSDAVIHDYQETLCKLIEKYGPQLNQSLSVSSVARFATLSALSQLDPVRRNFIIRLLYDAKLIIYLSVFDQPAVSLESANLTDLCLIDGTYPQTLHHLSMEAAIMTRVDFHSINIHGATFNKAILTNADFSGTRNILQCENEGCLGPNGASLYFQGSDLTSASFANAIYESVFFDSAKMIKTNLHSFQCASCCFLLADMTQTSLRNVDIRQSSFGLARLNRAEIHQSIFSANVDFGGADMGLSNVSHNNFTQCQFNYTQIRDAKFQYNTIVNSTFVKAIMVRISIKHDIFINVNFTNAQITESIWRYVKCERCTFNSVNFHKTDLTTSMFINSDFRDSIISEDQLNQAASLKGSILPNGTVIN